AVHREGAGFEPRFDRGDRLASPTVEHDVLVEVIGEHEHRWMREQYLAESRELRAGIDHAGRVRRVVDDDPPGPRRDCRVEGLGPHSEAVPRSTGYRHGVPAGEPHLVEIRLPGRPWDDDFVAGLYRRQEGIEDDLGGAIGDDHLVMTIVQIVLAAEFQPHGILQRCRAVHRRVLRLGTEWGRV